MYHTPCHSYEPDLSGAPFLVSDPSPCSLRNVNMRKAPVLPFYDTRVQKPTAQTLTSRKAWSPEEDKTIVRLRNQRVGWSSISKHFNGRSPTACRLRYHNYLQRWDNWDDAKKTQLVRQYLRHGSGLWLKIAKGMDVPPRAAEGMFWELRDKEIARRTGSIFSSHHTENFSSCFSTQSGSNSVSDMLESSGGTIYTQKPSIQLPSLKDVLSNLSACPIANQLPAIQSS
ncbi:uncharacterized protein N7511_004339 [Penicillium nucicola]|uniref:uncharacterized protein n=1 Tax=Penicillium nucicola TaxID=1850975 RepID=UPI002545A183|nr:uncharacterized protein N7511_004339 [Penicillium nucicola]KAJ5766723.1 hypothetical protein N7511_004339 [Penicillium nucicola]